MNIQTTSHEPSSSTHAKRRSVLFASDLRPYDEVHAELLKAQQEFFNLIHNNQEKEVETNV